MAKQKCPCPPQCVEGPKPHTHNRRQLRRENLRTDLTKALNAAMEKVARKHNVELENLTYSCDIVTKHDISGSVFGGF